MIQSNELKIITRDAGASGLHSNAEHWNEELFVLFNKNLSHRPVSQFLKSMALTQRMGTSLEFKFELRNSYSC
jgi:hypothetical protein